MKKFVIKSVFFSIFFGFYFLFINAFYMLIIASTDFNFIKRVESLKFENPDFELLVLGASLPQDGIDTELLTSMGIKSYNTSIDGSTIRTNYIQLTDYLTQYSKKPKIVLLGLNSYLDSFNDEGIHPIVEITMKDHKYSLDDVPVLKFKWLGFEFVKKIISREHRQLKLSYGQLRYRSANPDRTTFNESYLNIQKTESSNYIGEIAKFCDQNGLVLYILEMPGYRETQNQSEVGPYILKFDNGYSATLYNFRSRVFCEIFDAEKDWIGNSHLNQYGAAKFTKEIIGILGLNKSLQ